MEHVQGVCQRKTDEVRTQQVPDVRSKLTQACSAKNIWNEATTSILRGWRERCPTPRASGATEQLTFKLPYASKLGSFSKCRYLMISLLTSTQGRFDAAPLDGYYMPILSCVLQKPCYRPPQDFQ